MWQTAAAAVPVVVVLLFVFSSKCSATDRPAKPPPTMAIRLDGRRCVSSADAVERRRALLLLLLLLPFAAIGTR